jgi:hypothetical protein
LGGHASTLTLPGGLVMNDCVLGGTYSGFNNTLALLRQLGWKPQHEAFRVVFAHNSTARQLSSQAAPAPAAGASASEAATEAADAAAAKGGTATAAADAGHASQTALAALQAAAWGTHSPDSALFAAHARDIRVFTAALRWLWDTKQLLLLLTMPLRLLCRLLLCSDAFWQQMVAPIGVVFFGTGQRMGSCPVIILAGALCLERGVGTCCSMDVNVLTRATMQAPAVLTAEKGAPANHVPLFRKLTGLLSGVRNPASTLFMLPVIWLLPPAANAAVLQVHCLTPQRESWLLSQTAAPSSNKVPAFPFSTFPAWIASMKPSLLQQQQPAT